MKTPCRIFVPLLILWVCSGCAGSPSGPARNKMPSLGPDALVTRKIYGLLLWDNLALFNNCWRFQFLKDADLASSVMFYDPASKTCGWRWTCPKESEHELKAYPSLIAGDKVFKPADHDPSTDPRFPLSLSTMDTLEAAGVFFASGSGSFDFAFDLAFLDGPESKPERVNCEIMVWLDSSIPCVAPKLGEYRVDGYDYDFHVSTDWDPKVPYLAFLLKGDVIPDRVPLHRFIRIGIEKGYVDADAYLSAVELGPEIWWGEGEASVKNFRISLNGD